MQNLVLTVVALVLLREAYRYAQRVTRGRHSRTWPAGEGVVDISEPNVSCLERGEGSPLVGYAACATMTAAAIGVMGVVIF